MKSLFAKQAEKDELTANGIYVKVVSVLLFFLLRLLIVFLAAIRVNWFHFSSNSSGKVLRRIELYLNKLFAFTFVFHRFEDYGFKDLIYIKSSN